MGRFLIVALTVTTAALGLVLDNTILLIIAGGFLVVSLLILFLLSSKRSQRRSGSRIESRGPRTREEELRELGISEPRPKEPAVAREARVEYAPLVPETPVEVSHEQELFPSSESEEDVYEPAEADFVETDTEDPEEELPTVLEVEDNAALWQSHSPTAFRSFLRACWASTEVLSALLVYTEPDGSFSLLASQSHLKTIRNEGRFPADSIFSVATPSRAITILESNDPFLRDLPYYRTKTNVGSVAILPVQGSRELLYLVVDLAANDHFFTERQRVLLLHYASLLQAMLAHPQAEPVSRVVPTRRAIVSQEMSYARNNNIPLTLALVHRLDANTIESNGGLAVAEAERNLRLFLEDHSPGCRIERFGEMLFYGVFINEERGTVEEWADRVLGAAEVEGMPLAIGAAALSNQVDSEAFRGEAVDALTRAVQGGQRFVQD